MGVLIFQPDHKRDGCRAEGPFTLRLSHKTRHTDSGGYAQFYAMHIGAFGTWMDTDVLSATRINAANYLARMPRARAHLAKLDCRRRQNPTVPSGF